MVRRFAALCVLLAAALLSTGCLTQEEIAEARAQQGERGPYYERSSYGKAYFETTPIGAQILLWDGTYWRDMGTTPNYEPIVLESTGRAYLVRLAREGYETVEHTISLNRRQKEQTFTFKLREAVDGGEGPSRAAQVYTQENPRREAEPKEALPQNLWYQRTPLGQATIVSTPQDAEVEIYRDGRWLTVGRSGEDSPIALEATGRHYRIRLSKPGYLPMEEWIYLTGDQPKQTFRFSLTEDLAGSPEAKYNLKMDGQR